MNKNILLASLALLMTLGQAGAAETADAKREQCAATGSDAATCTARAEIEDAARCALANMRTASAGDEEAIPNPFRIISDRKEALRLLSDGDQAEALLIAQGTRALAGAACAP